jgi:hypothetical protein
MAFLAAFVARCFLGALPPDDLLAFYSNGDDWHLSLLWRQRLIDDCCFLCVPHAFQWSTIHNSVCRFANLSVTMALYVVTNPSFCLSQWLLSFAARLLNGTLVC